MSETTSPEQRQFDYATDAPVTAPAEDCFQRWPFARRLAEALLNRRDRSSLVIAIYGAWGEGKTSVLNLVLSALDGIKAGGAEEIIAYRFNPWRFTDDSQLLLNFFDNMAHNLDKDLTGARRREIGELLGQYGKIAAAILGRAELAEAISAKLKDTPLDELKERIEAHLEQESRRLVVLIDDLDRLTRKELQGMFRLLKLTADFRNTTYLLAFDPAVVADAIGEQYGGEPRRAGFEFLDKIVQVPLSLPAIPGEALKSYCFESLEVSLKANSISLGREAVHRFVSAYDAGMQVRVKTPRSAKRYANTLAFSLPILKGEVDLADLMLLEGVRLFLPELYHLMKTQPDVFLGREYRSDDEDFVKQNRAVIDEVMSDYAPEEREGARELVYELFPRLKPSAWGFRQTGLWHEQWAKNKRVASRVYYQRFFSYGVIACEVSDQELDDLLGRLGSEDDAELEARIEELVGPAGESAGDLVAKVRRKAHDLGDDGAKRLALVLARRGDLFPNPPSFMAEAPFPRAAMLVADLVSTCKEAEERLEVAKSVMETAKPLEFCAEILLWLRHADEQSSNAFVDSEMAGLGALLGNRIQQSASELANTFEAAPREGTRLLAAWSRVRPRRTPSRQGPGDRARWRLERRGHDARAEGAVSASGGGALRRSAGPWGAVPGGASVGGGGVGAGGGGAR